MREQGRAILGDDKQPVDKCSAFDVPTSSPSLPPSFPPSIPTYLYCQSLSFSRGPIQGADGPLGLRGKEGDECFQNQAHCEEVDLSV